MSLYTKKYALQRDRAARKPRICMLTETFYPVVGGGETYTRLLAGQFAALGADVFVLTRRVRRDLDALEEVDGVSILRLPPVGMVRFGKYAMLPFMALALAKMRGTYDLIYVVNFRVLGPAAALIARVLMKKCVLRSGTCGEMSGDYALAYRKRSILVKALLYLPMVIRGRIMMLADSFVSNNSAITEEFLRCGVLAERIQTLPNGIDTRAFRPIEPAERRRIRRDLGLLEDGFLVGYSGKLNRGKGLEHLITAWPEILSRYPIGHLVFIGSGGGQSLSCEEYLRDFARVRGLDSSITFTGYVSNVHEYLQTLDVFVLPTENEALSNALLEAMSCGLPCVASDVGGLPDIVEHGVNGLLIPPGSPDAILDAVSLLAEDRATGERLSSAARRTVEDRFALESLAKKHLEFLASLAGGSSGEEAVAVG